MAVCEEVVMGNKISFNGLVLKVQIMFSPPRKLEGGKKCIICYKFM
jgi:hypothetical protein